MKPEAVLEVMGHLVGYSEPYDDPNVDKVRYENQETLIAIAMGAVEDIIRNSKYKYSCEYSVARIGNRAYKALVELQDLITSNI